MFIIDMYIHSNRSQKYNKLFDNDMDSNVYTAIIHANVCVTLNLWDRTILQVRVSLNG